MSIIHDALKKTQDNLKNSEENPVPEKGQTPPENQNTERQNGGSQDVTEAYQKLHKGRTGIPPAPGSSDDGQKPVKRTFAFKKPRFIFLIFLLIGGLVAGFIYLKNNDAVRRWNQSMKRTKQRQTPTRVYEEGEMVLNGTALVEDRRTALINGKIYSMGETIEGKKIMNISLDSVELLNEEGKTITLYVRK